jgi:hypothetical protein
MGKSRQVLYGIALTLAVSATGAAQAASDRFVPFGEFVGSVRSAPLTRYAAVPQAQVQTAADFEQMRAHILRMYDGVHVKHSYALASEIYDCLPIMEQPSVRLQRITRIATPVAAPHSTHGASLLANGSMPATQLEPDQKIDRFGNAIGCEAGTVPLRRVTLGEITKFRTLQDFFHKLPFQLSPDATTPVSVHKYAHASQTINNHGGGQIINLWDPAVDTSQTEVFSLAQHWFVNFLTSGKPETVEGGWQDFPAKYGIAKPVLFIYWTADGYNKTGCYNTDCAAFVQVNSNVHLGAPFAHYSTKNGTQYTLDISWYQTGGNWWLYVGGSQSTNAVGYYPGTLYAKTPMANKASTIDYGGETVGTTAWPPMGSGKLPDSGFGVSAYQRYIHYFTMSNNFADATLSPSQLSPTCYKIKVTNNSTDASFRSYFYFGGPGGTGC